jgi:hypothetical protein
LVVPVGVCGVASGWERWTVARVRV